MSLPEIDEHIACSNAILEFTNRGERAKQHGKVVFKGMEADQWDALQRRKAMAVYNLGIRVPR